MVKSKQEYIHANYGGASLWMCEKVCPVCGRKFVMFTIEHWAWKYRGRPVCRYSCMRKLEQDAVDRLAESRNRRKVVLKKAQREALVQGLIIKGLTDDQIIERTGISRAFVRQSREKLEEAIE